MRNLPKFMKLFFAILVMPLSTFADVQVGYGTNTLFLPVNPSWGYSYSQVIYYQSEILTAGNITTLSWYFNGTSLSNSNDWTIYLGHTNKTEFASGTDWVPVSLMTQVWSGIFTSPSGPGWITFDITDFAYNNVDDLVIAVDENKPSWNGNGDRFYCTSVSSNRAILYYNDGTNPNPASPPSGSMQPNISDIILGGLTLSDPPSCAACISPPDAGTNILTSTTLNWSNGGSVPVTGYKLFFGTDSPPTNIFNGVDLGVAASYDPNPNMNNNTTYYWQVVPYNSVGDASGCPVWSFTTGGLGLQIGDGIVTTQPLPIGPNYNYTYSQVIYLQSEINCAGTISSLSWYYNGQDLYGSRDWNIYIGHTSKTSFSGTNDWIPVSSLTLVWTGTIPNTMTAGWVTVDITDFIYNNTDNLAVVVDENDGNVSGQNSFYCTSTATSRAICASGTTNPNPDSPPIGTVTNHIADIILGGLASELLPGRASLIMPSNGEINTVVSPSLKWFSGAGTPPAGYKIYFGTDNPPTNISNGIDLGLQTYYNPSPALANSTNYYWKIVPYNSNGEAVNCPVWSFRTVMAGKQVGTGFDVTQPLPIDAYYSYSYSQVIYLKSEINIAGTIDELWWYFGGTSLSGSNIWTIYLGHTSKTSFLSTTDWIPVTAMTQVWNGTFTSPTGPGWLMFNIDDFAYNNVDNLVIAVDENGSFYNSGTDRFRCMWVTSNRAIYKSDDYLDINPVSPPVGTRLQYIANVFLGGLGSITPPLPATLVSPVNSATNLLNTVLLNWTSGGGSPTGYKIYLGTDNPPTNILNGDDLGLVTGYDPSPDLDFMTTYYWKIVPYNPYGEATSCPVWSFTTGPDHRITTFPHTESFTEINFPYYGWLSESTGSPSYPGNWVRETVGMCCSYFSPHSLPAMIAFNGYWDNATSGIIITPPIIFPDDNYQVDFWMYRYPESFYPNQADLVNVYCNSAQSTDGAVLLGTIHRLSNYSPLSSSGWFEYSFNMPEGVGGNEHYIIFEGIMLGPGEMLIDDITFQSIPDCQTPIEQTVAAITSTTANLGWTETGSAPNWDIEIVEAGTPATGVPTFENVSTNPFTCDGLQPGKTYNWYVRANCGSLTSDWQGPADFLTAYSIPYLQDFDLYDMTGWTRSKGKPPIGTTSGWYNYLSAHLRVYGNDCSDWMFSPIIYLPNNNCILEFDLALQDYANIGQPPQGVGSDDKFELSISTDGGLTYNPLKTWSNNTSPKFSEIPSSFQHLIIDLSGYSGLIKLGFYGESWLSNAQNYLLVDSVLVWDTTNDPLCAELLMPSDGQNNNLSEVMLYWRNAAVATGYKLFLGTDYPPSNTLNGIDLGNVLTYHCTGLDFGATYYWQVESYNQNAVSTDCPVWSFDTYDPINEIPYCDSFDTYFSSGLPAGWSKTNHQNTNANIETYPNSSPPYSIRLSNYSSSDNLFLFSPLFAESIDLGSKQIKFKCYGYDGLLEVGTMTDPSNEATFKSFATINNLSYEFVEKTVYLNSSAGSDHYIAFKKGYNVCYLDDFCVEILPACLPPSDPMTSDITASSVLIGWTNNGEATSWNLEYGLSGFTQGTGTIVNISTNPYNLTDLFPNQYYDFYLQTDCGTEQSEWIGPEQFITSCTSYLIPQSENFDNGISLPGCWWTNVSGTTGWADVGINSYFSNSTPNSCYLASQGSEADRRLAWLISPQISGGLNGKMVSFFGMDQYESGNQYLNRIDIGAMSNPNDPQTFKLIQTIEFTNSFAEYTVYFGSAPENDEYVAFKQHSTVNYFNNIYLDDIIIDTGPPCVPPINLTADVLNESTATISWDEVGDATLWNIEYGEQGFQQGTGTNVNGVTNPFSLTGLAPSQSYDYYVQSDCGTELSTWRGIGNFATKCFPASIPWSENFDEVTYPSIPECIDLQTSETNVPWRVYELYSTSAPNSFVLYGLYDYYATPVPNDDWFFSAPLNLTGGISYKVSFYYINGNNEFTFQSSKMEVKWGTGPSSQEMTNGPIFFNNDIEVADWTQATSYFTPQTSGTYYIGWHGFSLGWAVGVDDIVVDLGPECPPPYLLTAKSVFPDSAHLSWLETGNATSWNIEYGETGFVPGTGTVISGVTNPFDLTGVTPAQTYDFYVQSDCSSSQSLWSERKTLVTPCEAVTIPFIEHFDYVDFPPCWKQTTSETVVADRWIIVDDYGLGTPVPIMRSLIYVNGNGTARLISPPIDLTGINPVLEFKHGLYNYGMHDLILKIQTSSDGINWTDEDWSLNPGDTSFELDTVTLTLANNLGPHTYIAWVFEGAFGNGAYWGIDDVYVDVASSHARPTALNAINIGDNSADLIWTSVSGLSEVDWMPAADSPGSGTKITGAASPLHISGLENETTYKFYVRDDWGSGDYSPWEGPFSFTTTAPCNDGTISENEPCNTWVNNTCETATPIYNGITICGTTWYTGMKSDLDEFKLELESGYQKVTMTVTSETGVYFGLEEQQISGIQDCDVLFYNVNPAVWTQFPGTNTLEVLLGNPGTYFFRIQQAMWIVDDCPGSKYTATWAVEQLDPPLPNISPTAFSVNVYPNGATQENLVIKNSGDFLVNYRAEIAPTDTVSCFPQPATFWTGSCTSSAKTQTSMISKIGEEVGWAKFDISSIPWDAKITSVKFHGYLTDYNGPIWFITQIPVIDPVTAPPMSIRDSIYSGVSYGFFPDTTLPSGYLTRDLNSQAITDLQEALFKGWFALGIMNSIAYHYTQFEGWAESHPPFLEITYIPNGWVTLKDSVYVSGIVPPKSTVNIPVNFNAGGMPIGMYSTEIQLNTNIDGDHVLPLIMNVEECISCPPGSVQENEFYGEDVNGGCNMPYGTEAFTQVENGVTICGNTWCDGYLRDTDWFELDLANGWNRITLEVAAGTDLDVGMVEQSVPGVAGCNNITGYLNPLVEVRACGSNTLEVFLENPGTYYFWIGQSLWNMSYLGTPYYATWAVETLDPPVANINPLEFAKELGSNQVVQDQLDITNNGEFPLKYHAAISYPDSAITSGNYYPQSTDYWTGSCNYSSKFQHSLIVGVGYTVGWAKFDISGIPDNATITKIKFHAYVEDNYWPYWSITPLGNVDPETSTSADINAFISDHFDELLAYSYNRESYHLQPGWLTRTLGNTANTDLQTTLSKDWFALGVIDFDFNSNYGIIFQGWAEANPPYLEVTYALNPVSWLNIDGGSVVNDTVAGSITSIISAGFNTTGVPTGSYLANISVTTNESGLPVYNIPVELNISTLFDFKAFLEGPFENGIMKSTLNEKNLLPLSQPYGTGPWNYFGLENVTAIPNGEIVDWVLVELRETSGDASTATSFKTIARKAGFIKSNGLIVETDGISPLRFDVTPPKNLYAIILHRNHLGIMSALPLSNAGGNYTYDFSSAGSQAYGATVAQKQLDSGDWGMISGDGNADNQINDSDKSNLWQPRAGTSGYKRGDFNLDGQLENSDKNEKWLPNIGTASQVPGGNPCPGIPSVNYDGRFYNTVQIGDQCWLQENINTGSMIQGDASATNNGIVEKYCYDNDSVNCNNYGGLYDWGEMMQYSSSPGSEGICPDGWHIPTDAEWSTLMAYEGGEEIAGGKIKEMGSMHWLSLNTDASNESGFKGLGGGWSTPPGTFSGLKETASFWSSSEESPGNAWASGLYYGDSWMYQFGYLMNGRFSVRCIKN